MVMKGTDFIFLFTEYLRLEKKYSKHTLIAYENDLRSFEEFLKLQFEIHEIKDAKVVMVRSWMASLSELNIDARSINRKISSLKSFFKFAMREKWVEKSPLEKIISPKVKKRLPVYLETRNTDLIPKIFEGKTDFKSLRDQMVVELLYGTGIRLSEALGLEESDINFNKNQIKVLGKRNKERIIPIPDELARILEAYIEKKRELGIGEKKIILTDKGEPGYPKLVYNIIKTNLSYISTLEKRSPHVLRHTYATQLLNNGADLNAIKELLGHANLQATQVYTHNSIDRLKEIHQQAHPKS